MKRLIRLAVLLAAGAFLSCWTSSAEAQIPITTYYAPAPTVMRYAPAPVVVTRRVPIATTAPVVTARPIVVGAAPVVTARPALVPAPVPVTSYYAPAAPAYGFYTPYGGPEVRVPGQPLRNVLRAIVP